MIFDQLSNLQRYIPSLPALHTVCLMLESGKLRELEYGSYQTDNPQVRFNLVTYRTTTPDAFHYEVHQKEVDVQILLSGFELMEIASPPRTMKTIPYDAMKDAAFIEGTPRVLYHASPDTFALFFPKEPHICNLIDQHSTDVVKVVFKILL